MKKKYRYKYISKIKSSNLKIPLPNFFLALGLLHYFLPKKKRIHLPGTIPDHIYVESFYTMKTIPNGDLEIAKLIMRYSGLSSRRYQYS